MWAVQDAKAKLSKLLSLAKAGKPQIIGLHHPCVLISMADYQALQNEQPVHFGRWLVENAPRGEELELPSRTDGRPDPFADHL